ncbi:hypothetical protein ACM01_39575 [Streptomyces viridochromogenes]|uniref:Uncharacterized protein n=1 Tax=Streptomyces viridochromogenes TaxID=1938 RepID=A0A0J7YXI8_STRVR|nr:hypothetical protein ACM01_39575 [Streptomyces viridochromogenes]KOG08789.1 hypothetical protein ADK35_41045 [Streptomyces viridochromogenes]KOG09131.1 hypothetical protein ADK36_41780 [Streptomyces viridochromogenes]
MLRFPGQIEAVLVEPHSPAVRPRLRSAHLVESLRSASGRVHQVRLAQTEHGGVGQRLVQIGVEESVGLLDLVANRRRIAASTRAIDRSAVFIVPITNRLGGSAKSSPE